MYSFFVLVDYVYAVEVERKNWGLFFAGLAFWGMDWFIEIWNGLVFYFTAFWVHDLESVRRKAFVAGGILAFDLAALVVFDGILRWI
jgi:hypothetical protein